VIGEPDGNVWINTTGNPGMASGGMGDTLTGIIGGLMAQWKAHESLHNSTRSPNIQFARIVACAGAHLHGMSGDLAAAEHGEAGTTAGDVITNLPAAIRAIQRRINGS
jgi:NAD(P)H-hydrate epimerase